jgi:hypothetical protein
MDAVIIRAEKRAVSALIKEIKRREAYHSLEKHRGRQLLKVWFLKELWRRVYRIASKMAEEDTFPESLHSVYLAFAGLSKDGCIITETPAWVQIKLTNHTYWISQSSGCLYITAGNMDTFPIKMSSERLVSMLRSFDAYLGKNLSSVDEVFELAIIEYYAAKKSGEILKATAMNLIGDLMDEPISFEVKMQKNGRLCFTIDRRASWLPNKVFRTTFETLREDFAKAYKEYKAQYRYL